MKERYKGTKAERDTDKKRDIMRQGEEDRNKGREGGREWVREREGER